MNNIREHCLQSIKSIYLKHEGTESGADADTLCQNIEKGIFNKSLKIAADSSIEKSWENDIFCHIYKQRYIEIYLNMKQNPGLIDKLRSKAIDIRTFSNSAYEELNSDRWKPVEFVDDNIEDGIFKCRQCGSRKTTYYSLQTRSADEPMTNFITCIQCKNRWKM